MIDEVLRNSAANYPDGLAIVSGDTRWTFAQLNANANAAANTLLVRGVRRGDIVVIYAHDTPMLLALIAGIMKIGAIAVCLPPSGGYLATRALHDALGKCHFIDDSNKYYEGSGEEPEVGELPTDLPAMMFSSSGTTGTPKWSVATRAAIGHRIAAGVSILTCEPGDRLFSTLPMTHSFAIRHILGALASGAAYIFNTASCSLSIETSMANGGATLLLTTTGAFASLTGSNLWGHGSVRRVIANGKVETAALDAFRSVFPVPLTVTYGASEVGTLMETDDVVPGRIGRALSGADVKIKNGELFVKSCGLASGYWVNGSLMPIETDEEGFWPTGDLVKADKGEYTFVGRKGQ
jgi:acyl-coenzyme A synthetase/AMP-(fatty) acid ligase